MEFKDYYQTLGVKRDASDEEIKRAYRRGARKYHPDVSDAPDAEARFKELAEAYEVLKDPEKRAAYDRFGKDWKAGQDFTPPPGWERHSGVHPEDMGFGGQQDFSDFFESLFGGGFRSTGAGPQRPRRQRGEDMETRLQISLEDAYQGQRQKVRLQIPEVDAQGRVVRRDKTLNVKIPKGIVEGQKIRLPGQGGAGFNDGPAGDLYAVIQFKPHPHFRAEQRDIHLELPITPWEAALGAELPVPTLGGKVNLKIPKGASSGTKLRLKGRGLPGAKTSDTPGDQFVILKVVVPKADTEELETLYQRLAEVAGTNPRAHLAG